MTGVDGGQLSGSRDDGPISDGMMDDYLMRARLLPSFKVILPYLTLLGELG